MSKKFKILIANGVNLDLLGTREPKIYGKATLAELESDISGEAERLSKYFDATISLSFFQSNSEAELLNRLSGNWDGIVLNAGAWTHTSLALADRLKAIAIPFVEVHISNLATRESFRHKSYSAVHANGVIYGLGSDSYSAGLFSIVKYLCKSL